MTEGVFDPTGRSLDARVLVERRTTHITPSGTEQRFRWLAGHLR